MLTFTECAITGGRLIARAGSVDVGFIFPPAVGKKGFQWVSRLPTDHQFYKKEKTLEDAQDALQGRWEEFLRLTGTAEVVALEVAE